jgi:hypothetical protein
MRKTSDKSQLRFYKILDQYFLKLESHLNQRKSKNLSQPREAQGDTMPENNVGSWMRL